jgi:serine protease Do
MEPKTGRREHSSIDSPSLLKSRFTRRSVAVFLCLAIGGAAGCGQTAHQATPATQAGSPAATEAPAAATAPVAAPLPPGPVPATFDVAALADRVKPMVVNITTRFQRVSSGNNDPFGFFFGPEGARPQRREGQAAGTGFLIDSAGYVVTNEHVVREAREVRVRLMDEREFVAEVVGRDPKLDLALLKLQGAKDLPAAALGNSEQLRVGESVLAVGNPFGLGHTVTLGIVSAKARTIDAGPYDDFIQTDASINPGNSGGPLFNWRGEVVGINTAIRAGANGIGFAIPVDALKDVLPQLREKGRVDRGRLGLGFQPVTPELARALDLEGPRGALVAEVEPGAAAARAGIRSGDVIVAVNGASIAHAEELPRHVAKNPPGSSVKVTIVRNKVKQDVTAKLDVLPDDEADARPATGPASPPEQTGKLGIGISDAPGGGVRVEQVTGTQSRELVPGDVIVEVAGTPVKDSAGLKAAVTKLKPGSIALLKVKRGKVTRFAAVPIPS